MALKPEPDLTRSFFIVNISYYIYTYSNMHKRNDNSLGFGAIEIVLVIFIVVLITAVVYFAYNNRHNNAQALNNTEPTSTATTPKPATNTGSDDALKACQTWKVSDSQSAADGSTTIKTAAQQAKVAASHSSQWKALAQDMTFVSSLPETGNTEADVSQSSTDLKAIHTTCATLGVEVSPI